MLNRRTRSVGAKNAVCVTALLTLLIPGCWGQNNGLSPAVTLELPNGTTVTARAGTGAPSLANSSWQLFRASDTAQAAPVVALRFGSGGKLVGFDNATIVNELFGSTIRIDGRRHNTPQPGLQYAATTYGAETEDSTGIAFKGRVVGFFAGIQAAYANATASATFDEGDPTTMRGTFSFTTRVTITSIAGANQDDTFPFVARRVEE